LGTYHPDTPYLREQGCEDPWLFSEPKGAYEQKSLENIDVGLSGRNLKLIF